MTLVWSTIKGGSSELAMAPLGRPDPVLQIGQALGGAAVLGEGARQAPQLAIVPGQVPRQGATFGLEFLGARLGLDPRLFDRLGQDGRVLSDAADLVDDEALDLRGRDRFRRAGVPAAFLRIAADVVPVTAGAVLQRVRRDHRAAT